MDGCQKITPAQEYTPVGNLVQQIPGSQSVND